MNWALVITVNDIPKLVQPVTTVDEFNKHRGTFQKLGIVLSLNEYNAFGFTDNEGKAQCYHLTQVKEARKVA